MSSMSSRAFRSARPPAAMVWVMRIFFLLLAMGRSSPISFHSFRGWGPLAGGTCRGPLLLAVDFDARDTGNPRIRITSGHPTGRGDLTMFNPLPETRLLGLGLALMFLFSTGE